LVICKQMRIISSVLFLISLSFFLPAEGTKETPSVKTKKNTTDTPPVMPAMPPMPSVSSLSMPTITAPTIGGTFYVPGVNPGTQSASDNTASLQTSSSTATAQPASVSSPVTDTASLSSSATASDLASLDTAGLLSSFYSTLKAPLNTETSSTNALLTNVLDQLKELKQENKSAITGSQAKKDDIVSNNSTEKTDRSQPSILRFIVNGYDVLATCRTVYFSSRETDGSFLLTGDRKYTSDGKTRDETFYLLFKTKGSSGFCSQYIVEPAVVQDYTNKYSFVYQLVQKNNLAATKTGNLVTMRLSEPLYNMDLLIDLGTKNK